MKKSSLIIIFILFGFLYFYKLGSYKLFDVDEPRYAEAAREMIESGNWITPTFNYTPRLDKPILFYWLIAMAYKIFGINEFSARFFSALSGFSLIIFTFIFVKKFISLKSAIMSSLILGTSPHIFLQSHFSITDMTLSLFISSSLFFFYLGYVSKSIWLYVGFYIMMGLAVLTKGPLGIILPLSIIAIFFLSAGRIKDVKSIKDTIKEMHPFIGGLIFLIIVLPWYILVIEENGRFINYFFIKHNFTRYITPLSGHSGPIFFYIPVILIGLLPWSLYLPVATKDFFPFNIFLNKNKDGFSLNIIKKDIDNVLMFLVIWTIVTFIFFSISKTKLVTYILPIYPPLSIIVGRLLEKGLSFNCKINIMKSGVILGVIYIIFYIIMSLSILVFGFINNIYIGFRGIFLIILIILLSSLLLKKIKREVGLSFFTLNIILSIIFLFTLIDICLPIVNHYRQNDLYEISKRIIKEMPKEGNIVMFNMDKPTVVFYTKTRVKNVDDCDIGRLENLLKAPLFLITNKDSLKYLHLYENLHIIEKRKTYILLSNLKDCLNRRKIEK